MAVLWMINIPKIEPYFLCKVFSLRRNIPHVVPGQNIRIVQAHFTFFNLKDICDKVILSVWKLFLSLYTRANALYLQV